MSKLSKPWKRASDVKTKGTLLKVVEKKLSLAFTSEAWLKNCNRFVVFLNIALIISKLLRENNKTL